jgi:hypothetical protein
VNTFKRRVVDCPYCGAELPNDTLERNYLFVSSKNQWIRCSACCEYSQAVLAVLSPGVDAPFDATLPFRSPAFQGGVWPPTCVACGAPATRRDSIDRKAVAAAELLVLQVRMRREFISDIPYCETHKQGVDVDITGRSVWLKWGNLSALRAYIDLNKGKPQLTDH